MKLLFLDTETTGLNPQTAAIHQLAGMVVINGTIKESFNYRIRPHEGAEIKEAALEVSGVNSQMLSLYTSSGTQLAHFTALLSRYVNQYDKTDKFYPVGFNSRAFDEPFLRNWFLVNGNNYYGSFFWQIGFDVMVLAAHHLRHGLPAMPNFRLPTVAAEMGVPVQANRLHDALYDVELTKAIYDRLQEPVDAAPLARKVLATLDQQQRYFQAARTGTGKPEALALSKKMEGELKEMCFEIVNNKAKQQTLF